MKIARELEQLCSACINHFGEFDLDKTGNIKVFSFELGSYTIWGGNGDRYEDRTYYISKEGWLVRDTITETGLYQRGDGTVEDRTVKTSPANIEKDVNGSKTRIFDIESLIRFYGEVHQKYPREFELLCDIGKTCRVSI